MPAGQHIAHFYICTRSARSSFSPSPALPRLGHRDKLLELILGGGHRLRLRQTTQTHETRREHTHMDSLLCPGPPRALMTSWLNSMLNAQVSLVCISLLLGWGGWGDTGVTVSACVHHLTGCLCTECPGRLPHTRGPAWWAPGSPEPGPGSPGPGTQRPERADRAQPARCLTHPVQLCTHHIMSLKTFCKHQ